MGIDQELDTYGQTATMDFNSVNWGQELSIHEIEVYGYPNSSTSNLSTTITHSESSVDYTAPPVTATVTVNHGYVNGSLQLWQGAVRTHRK